MNIQSKRIRLLLLLVGALGALLFFFVVPRTGGSPSYRTAAVKRGDIQITIGATGTVEPEELVDVGAQVAGKVLRFGKDRSGKVVDYGSEVEAGMVLAQIDDSLYSADVAQAEGQLALAKAGLDRAEADLLQLRAKADQAERDWSRARKLGPSEALARAAYDAALSACEVARGNLAVGNAAISQARGSVAQAQATVAKARQNLDYCTIKSPVDGVVIDRRVNIGQTVVASLNAPSLFLIAKDLKRLQIWVAVNEADIGRIQQDQPVAFTVDAFPGEAFEGRVAKVRLNANMTQNVVSYIVEVSTDNSSGKLLPYLSANAKLLVDERRQVLMAPNATLKWAPKASAATAGSPGKAESGTASSPTGAGPRRKEAGAGEGTVWLSEGETIRPVKVRMGLSDGSWTEIQGEEIKEGTLLVVGERVATAGKEASSTVNPFTPKLPGMGRGGGPPR